MERDSFVFYRSFKVAVYALPENMQLSIIKAILDYALDGKEPSPDGVERAILELIRPQLEANNKRYENGKKGGAPKGNKNAKKYTANSQKTTENNQNQPNVNVNANDNDTTVVVNAREAFCKAYGVTVDDTTTNGIDFAVLSKSYSESAKFLQKHQVARRMSWIVKHYDEILSGKFVDYRSGDGESPRVTDRIDASVGELNARFASLTEEEL